MGVRTQNAPLANATASQRRETSKHESALDTGGGDAHRPDSETAPLTPREREVYELAVQGMSYQDIARRMCVEYHTVRTYISNVSRRLGVRPPLKAWLDDVDFDRLSPRERQCVELSRRNLRPAEIAAELGIAYDTVHNYLRSARRKYRAGEAGR